MNTKQGIKGFTIIEVVLVLAIAGLIFLMVFVALPALQSGQRDTARKDDIGAISSALSNYTANNRGTWPDGPKLTSAATNISGNTTSITVVTYTAPVTFSPTDGQVRVYTGAKCGTANTAGTGYGVVQGSARQAAVITRLEASGGSAFCQDV